ncbi:MAG: hypothetical protein PHS44_04960 [Candidatus Dojkabacteria bacterium]|nr:hypothetical protein [Candidatus Dojkabacteria bacterium]
MKNFFKTTLFFVFLVIFFVFVFSLLPEKETTKQPTPEGSGVEGISVSASIKIQEIAFKVYPEKRIPKSGNWDTIADFNVYCKKTGKKCFSDTISTNNEGIGILTLNPGNKITSGNNSVIIKGISHLSKVYPNVPFIRMYENYDFTVFGDLLAGDTHPSYDDFINSLDISTLINNLNSNDYVSDLNGDSFVNSLDLSIQVYNISRTGEKV